MTILTALPKRWSTKQIEEEFGVSNHMAHSVKKLVTEKGILSTPNPKPGKTLNETTGCLFVDFCNRDEVSRMMPGKKGYMTTREKGLKIQAHKQLMLSNLSEVYQLFKEKNSSHCIGFSKFSELNVVGAN